MAATAGQFGPGARCDLVLRGGRIIDGTGNPWFEGDLAIQDGRIAAMGDLREVAGAREIDLRGCVAAPGFIEIRGQGAGAAGVRHGVTTRVIPCRSSVADFLDEASRVGHAANLTVLADAGALRRQVIGERDRPLAPAEAVAWKRAAAQALAAGAFGICAGGQSRIAPRAGPYELLELATVAAEHQAFGMLLLPADPARVELAVAEALAVSEGAGLPVHLGRLRPGSPDEAARLVRTLDDALASGADVTADLCPCPNTLSPLLALLPAWALAGGEEAWLLRAGDPAVRLHMRQSMEAEWASRLSWSTVRLGQLGTGLYSWASGQPILSVAAALGAEPWEAVLRLLEAYRWEVEGTLFPLPEGVLGPLLAHPAVMLTGCDDSCTSFSTYVEGRHAGALPDAVRKLTSLPARRLRLWDRGLLRPGLAADIVCFDPYRPGRLPWVVVAGKIAVEAGEMTEARSGAVLRHRATGYRG